ncbi:MAG: sodium:proton exchanger [Planctomycetes bacterium]|nr:sodium:proton exchanger [Planctomycetota bacterium]
MSSRGARRSCRVQGHHLSSEDLHRMSSVDTVHAATNAALLNEIGLSIVVATAVAFLGMVLRQPPILAYLAAGVFIGPRIGVGWVSNEASIEIISEIGLILLLFIIGLEIDLKAIARTGRVVLLTGALQYPLCVALGVAVAAILGRLGCPGHADRYAALYLALAAGLSSTMIVVKLLYDKQELDTQAGRISLGVLVLQDLWAIVVLAIQPNFQNPALAPLLAACVKGFALLAFCLAVSRFVLPLIFKSVAKVPELMLIVSLAWCFLVCGLADRAGLSKEMGALMAGACISTFPYSVGVVAKVTSIRDFFVTLFFVALGMKIPMPTLATVGAAILWTILLAVSRLVSVFPILYKLKQGLRVSFLSTINLAQVSEFSLVIAALGAGYGHIAEETVTVVIFVFVITSVLSTYLIMRNDALQRWLSLRAQRLGLSDVGDEGQSKAAHDESSVVILGFYRVASALLQELEKSAPQILQRTVVIDFNPDVHAELKRRGYHCVYGDIAHADTLRHVIHNSPKVVLSTIPDSILKGITNQRLLQMARSLWPEAQIMVTAESGPRALDLYDQGADFVIYPHEATAKAIVPLLSEAAEGRSIRPCAEPLVADLRTRQEVIR